MRQFAIDDLGLKGNLVKDNQITLFGLTLKAIVAHTLTYFLYRNVYDIHGHKQRWLGE